MNLHSWESNGPEHARCRRCGIGVGCNAALADAIDTLALYADDYSSDGQNEIKQALAVWLAETDGECRMLGKGGAMKKDVSVREWDRRGWRLCTKGTGVGHCWNVRLVNGRLGSAFIPNPPKGTPCKVEFCMWHRIGGAK